MKNRIFALLAGFLLLLSACTSNSSTPASESNDTATVPEFHAMAYDPALDTLNDEYGADAFEHALDHTGSRYYVANDFYNMESGGSLHILPRFQTYQQTTEYSCGCAAALMVLNYFGNQDYNELEICELVETDTSKGTTVEGLADFFDKLGWETSCHADTDYHFQTINECEAYLIETLDSGIPVLMDWVDWAGHWQVLIGLDTCGTDSPYDDVLIMADPYDVTDHYQDGYYTVPFGRFFEMWREGPCTQKTDPYKQPFVVAFPSA